MDIAIIFSKEWNISPFEVLQQDIDDFILVAKHLIKMGKNTTGQQNQKPTKINDGFWDF